MAHSPDFVVNASGTTYRVIRDQLGSPLLVVNIDDANDVLLEARYTAFGERTVVAGSADVLTLGFAGGIYDEDTGLTRFGARDYDAVVGRWTAKDPILWGGGQANLYVYVGGDPVNLFDPNGRWVNYAVGAVVGAGASVLVQSAMNGRVNWGDVGITAAFGALTGGLSAGASFGQSAAVGASGSVFQYAVTEWSHGGQLSWSGAYGSALWGGLAGGLGALLGPVAQGIKYVENAAQKGAIPAALGRALNDSRAPALGLQNLSVQSMCGVVGAAPTEE